MKRLLILLLWVLSSTLSVTMAQDDALEQESFLLTFVPNIQFAPIYVAQEAGFFEQAGFDVSLQYLDEPDVVDLVASGESNFGVVSGEQVILATAQGRPITYVYEWFQQFPIGIMYDDQLDVVTVADLLAMDPRVGIPGRFGATYSGFIALLQSYDLDVSDVRLDEIGFAASEVFCLGAVDASVIYLNNEPLQVNNRAEQGDCGAVNGVNVLPIAETIDLVSNGIITNQVLIDEQPERVRAFVGAYDAGLALTIDNPARAYLLSASAIPDFTIPEDLENALTILADEQDAFLGTNPDREAIATSRAEQFTMLSEQFDAGTLLQFQVLLRSIELWEADQLGYTDADSWLNMRDTLVSLGQLDADFDLAAIYTNDFLPVNDNE
ncbi:MAG: ABC transporter substrate-binding protein [Anaerolineae bacterium]